MKKIQMVKGGDTTRLDILLFGFRLGDYLKKNTDSYEASDEGVVAQGPGKRAIDIDYSSDVHKIQVSDPDPQNEDKFMSVLESIYRNAGFTPEQTAPSTI